MRKIIDSVITEQDFNQDEIAAINAGTKAFLDKKGIQGSDLTTRIKMYQKSIGQDQTGHMLDSKIPEQDKSIWQKLINANKSIFDKVLDKLHNWLGIGMGSGF